MKMEELAKMHKGSNLPKKQINKTALNYLAFVWRRAVMDRPPVQYVPDLTTIQIAKLKHIRDKLLCAGIDPADTLVLVVQNWPTFVHAVLAERRHVEAGTARLGFRAEERQRAY